MEKIRDLKIKVLLELDEACQNSINYKNLIEKDLKKFLDLNKKSLKKINELELYNNYIIPQWDEVQNKYDCFLEKNASLIEELLILENDIEHEKKIWNNLLNASFKCGNQKFLFSKKTYKEDNLKFENRKKGAKKEIESAKINLDKICEKRKMMDEIIFKMLDDIKNAINIVYITSSSIKTSQKLSGKIFQFSKTNALKDKILLFENLSLEKPKDSWLLFIERYIKCSFIHLPFNYKVQSFYQLQINKINQKRNSYNLILKMLQEVLVEGKEKLINIKKDIDRYEQLCEEENNKLKLSIVPDVSSCDYINDKLVIENEEEEFYITTNKLKIQKEWIKECKKLFEEISLTPAKKKKLLYNKNFFFIHELNNNSLQKNYITQASNTFNQIKKIKKEIRLMERSFVARKNEKFLLNEELERLKVVVKELEKKEKVYDKSFFSISTTTNINNGSFNKKNIIDNKNLEKVCLLHENNKNLINQKKIKIEEIKNNIKQSEKIIKEEKLLYSTNNVHLKRIQNKLITQKQPSSTIFNYHNILLQEKSLLLKDMSYLEKQLSRTSEIRMNIVKKKLKVKL